MAQNALWRKEVPFLGQHDGRQHFGVQIPQKPSKMAFYKHFQVSANGLQTNDVIEEWCHWLAVAHGQAAYTIYSIWEITAAVYFYNIYNATIVSAGALYSVRIFSFCKIYTVFVGNLFYRLKKIPYAVCWKASKTSKTLISKQWTLGDIAIRLTFRTTRL